MINLSSLLKIVRDAMDIHIAPSLMGKKISITDNSDCFDSVKDQNQTDALAQSPGWKL